MKWIVQHRTAPGAGWATVYGPTSRSKAYHFFLEHKGDKNYRITKIKKIVQK